MIESRVGEGRKKKKKRERGRERDGLRRREGEEGKIMWRLKEEEEE